MNERTSPHSPLTTPHSPLTTHHSLFSQLTNERTNALSVSDRAMPHFFSAAPARRLRTGDAKVRTGVRRRSGCVTGAGGEASKARNAEVCLRAGWRLRRPAAGAPSASAARRLRRPRPNAERRRWTSGGREQVSGRSAGSTQATVVPKPMRIRGCAGLARYVSASPASDTESRGLGTMLVRARQSAQPVHAVLRPLEGWSTTITRTHRSGCDRGRNNVFSIVFVGL